MSMLGLKTLPRDHPLHRVYQTSAGLIGVLLVALSAVALLRSGDRFLGVGASTRFCVLVLVVGLVLIGAAVAGGNVAAQVNGHLGAILIALGLFGLLVSRTSWNVLDLRVSDVIVLFVVGVLLLAAGFYGQVAASGPFGDSRGPHHGEEPPETGRPATGDPLGDGAHPRSEQRDRR